MIRGPVLPKMRDSLWELVSARLDQIESGLTLVLESLECGDPALGVVDGLARDAMGGPVLVMLAVDGDTLLPARALAADRFLQRVGAALAQAVPEANFGQGLPGRLLVIGTESSAAVLDQVCALPLQDLQVCTLEPFRVAGAERFAVRWVSGAGAGGVVVPGPGSQVAVEAAEQLVEFVVPPARAALWEDLRKLCDHIDPAVVVHGDRFSRRITWNGYLLGEVRSSDGALIARAATGLVLALHDVRDVRQFCDQLLRAFSQRAGLELDRRGSGADKQDNQPERRPADAGAARLTATRHAAGGRRDAADREPKAEPQPESLRSSLSASRLSPEEHSALGEPVTSTGSRAGGSVANETKPTAPTRGS